MPPSDRLIGWAARRFVGKQPRISRDGAAESWHASYVTTIVDTHRLISDLKQRGFTAQQAEGITEAIAAQQLDHLATKADIRDLEIRLLKWAAPVLIGQVAVFAAVVEWVLGR